MNFNRIQEAEEKLWDFSAYFWNTPRTCKSRMLVTHFSKKHTFESISEISLAFT